VTSLARSLSVLLLLAVAPVTDAAAEPVRLKSRLWQVSLESESLAVEASEVGGQPFLISLPQPDLGPAANLVQKAQEASWDLPKAHVSVKFHLDGDTLTVGIHAEQPTSFTWPMVGASPRLKALIWPRWEGCYIPTDDERWITYLVDHGPWKTLDGLCMPFWGHDYGNQTLTYIVTNRFNNAFQFTKADGEWNARFTHEFPPNHATRDHGFVIKLGGAPSPVEPARQFRKWLTQHGQFVSLRDKCKANPKVERLLGAAHVYLWGGAYLTRHDIPRKQWVPFCRKLLEQGASDSPSPGRRIKTLMKPEIWEKVREITTLEWPYNFIKTQVTDELSGLLERTDFYDDTAWQTTPLPSAARRVLQQDRDSLPVPKLCRANAVALHAAFPKYMHAVDEWGDGVSKRMLGNLQRAGFDRMRLCVDGIGSVARRPEVALLADRMGYLFGTYDSFHSIHDPALKGTDASWDTAQFDKKLYETGAIVTQDGKKRRGFKGRGCKLSPIAARPYVEVRVNENLKRVPFNYYFVDCDAYGEVYDNYCPAHPATQAQDAQARIDRLQWIAETYKLVIGSEGGSSYAAPVVHVIEGMVGPIFGWSDPDRKDRNSKYFRGTYYPPDGPRVFFQAVPIKEKYVYLYYDPRFRLPLNEIVFHDSFVSTHHWGNASLKNVNVRNTVALTEMLYLTPPLYHLNLDTLAKQADIINSHYAAFSPLHRELGFAAMTDFKWLSPDRLVQMTVFDDRVEVIANFSQSPHKHGALTIPPRSVTVRWTDSGKTRTYTPAP
jgi:hypothetical protein